MEARDLPIDAIVLDPDLNLRDRLDPETVERYGESWESLPAVTVFDVEGDWLLVDGFHRHAAFVAKGRESIPASVHRGTYEHALEFAAGANLAHGLPLSRRERRRAVEVKLRLRPEQSDRQFAKELGVSRDLVARVRGDLAVAGAIPAVRDRIGADGKRYPAPIGLPRDPNEAPPTAASLADSMPRVPGTSEDDESAAIGPRPPHRGGRGDDHEPRAHEPRDLARSGPVPVATPTIDEMLELMTRQVLEVVAWAEGDDFTAAFRGAGDRPRKMFHAAVRALAEQVGRLDPASAPHP